MKYEHTQKAPLGWLLILSGGLVLMIDVLAPHRIAVILTSSLIIIILGFLGLCFGRLTVCDEETFLSVRFGPLPVFRTTIPYSAITGVEAARSNFLDGWGIHWLPGRGYIFNIWGFGCVRILMGEKIVRVGSDDVDRLVSFLESRVNPDS